jgi:hypothetical protein
VSVISRPLFFERATASVSSATATGVSTMLVSNEPQKSSISNHSGQLRDDFVVASQCTYLKLMRTAPTMFERFIICKNIPFGELKDIDASLNTFSGSDHTEECAAFFGRIQSCCAPESQRLACCEYRIDFLHFHLFEHLWQVQWNDRAAGFDAID